MQPDYAPVVHDALDACQQHLGARLRTAYISGSVGLGEALPGISDVDWFCFTTEAHESDEAWAKQSAMELRRRHPLTAVDFHLNVLPVARLAKEGFWRFILRYNAARVYGDDLVAELEAGGIAVPRPGPELARSRRGFVARCLDQAMKGERPESLGLLPEEPALAARKLARNFVVVEGAFLLMVEGRFASFKQEMVLAGLRHGHPQWADLYDLTERLLVHPRECDVGPKQTMPQCEPFVRFILGQLQ